MNLSQVQDLLSSSFLMWPLRQRSEILLLCLLLVLSASCPLMHLYTRSYNGINQYMSLSKVDDYNSFDLNQPKSRRSSSIPPQHCPEIASCVQQQTCMELLSKSVPTKSTLSWHSNWFRSSSQRIAYLGSSIKRSHIKATRSLFSTCTLKYPNHTSQVGNLKAQLRLLEKKFYILWNSFILHQFRQHPAELSCRDLWPPAFSTALSSRRVYQNLHPMIQSTSSALFIQNYRLPIRNARDEPIITCSTAVIYTYE